MCSRSHNCEVAQPKFFRGLRCLWLALNFHVGRARECRLTMEIKALTKNHRTPSQERTRSSLTELMNQIRCLGRALVLRVIRLDRFQNGME